MASSFKSDFSWSERMQQLYAVQLYEDYWDGCEVIEVDSAGKDQSVARQLDFGDVDKMICLENGSQIHIAQRFRRPRDNGKDVDFSFRSRRKGCDYPVEYDRLMDAFDTVGASYPRYYAFGVTKYGGIENGFDEFWIFRTKPILQAIKDGRIIPSDEKMNPDGKTWARYIPIRELVEIGAVENRWDFEDEDSSDGEFDTLSIGYTCENPKCGSWVPHGSGDSLSMATHSDASIRINVCSDCAMNLGGDGE